MTDVDIVLLRVRLGQVRHAAIAENARQVAGGDPRLLDARDPAGGSLEIVVENGRYEDAARRKA